MKNAIYILLLCFLTACSNEVNEAIYPENDSSEIKQVLNNYDSVKGYSSVTDKNDVLVAIDIRRMSRFNKEKIEKKISKKLEEKFPDKEVLVTSDLKIRWEVEKIIEQSMQEDEMTKSIKKIKSLSKEET
ncbi:YhcN/YlaJ family sporulation lipoprotein [Psychrobacillus vulpis]|uniref:Sporulation protein n=1 Tax=Psychrobacillus vulpis TaxID=2325572 RepID=A0A544TRZ0_9BACI|nr:YhcN/YlaJ family sporulation lipoprotein [Psychrobacillus vulpis]TQR20205.1 hypothetical protein FG384_08565 [Psychrobacillus vulpis]